MRWNPVLRGDCFAMETASCDSLIRDVVGHCCVHVSMAMLCGWVICFTAGELWNKSRAPSQAQLYHMLVACLKTLGMEIINSALKSIRMVLTCPVIRLV